MLESHAATCAARDGARGSAQADAPTRDGLLMKLMEWPNQMWCDLLAQAKATNGESLKDPNTMKQLQTIIRTNERVAFALGNPYTVQLGHIYVDLLNVYKVRNTSLSSPGRLSPALGPITSPRRC